MAKKSKKQTKETSPESVAASAAQPVAETQTVESASTERKPSTRRPTIVKSEARANLVPINVDEEVRRLAYLLSERRGFEPGHETEDWLAAEREVRQRYQQHTA